MNATVFKTNEMRRFPTKKEFLKDKKLNDIIYGFFQTHSYLNIDGDKKQRYCLKSEASAGKIISYFNSIEKPAPVSERTIRNMIKLFAQSGILSEGVLDKKKVYFLPDLKDGEYAYIKTETLRFLVNTSTSNVIKTYAFLKKKWEQHIDFKYKEPYRFSQSKLLEVIGYTSKNNSDNLEMIKDILTSLQNNGLVEIHKEWVPTGNDNVTEYFVLDAVNDDYIHSVESKVKDDSYVAVPVSLEEFKAMPKAEAVKILGF